MKFLKEFFIKIGKIKRQWIFLIVGLSVLIPLVFPVNIPIQPSEHSKTVYEALNNLDTNSKILL